MRQLQTPSRKYRKFISIISIGIVVILVMFFGFIGFVMYDEAFCKRESHLFVSDFQDKLVPVTQEEAKIFGNKAKISTRYREELRCSYESRSITHFFMRKK